MQHTIGRYTDTHLIPTVFKKKGKSRLHDTSRWFFKALCFILTTVEYAPCSAINSWFDCINWYFTCYTETTSFVGQKDYHASLKKNLPPSQDYYKKESPLPSPAPSPISLPAERKQMLPHPPAASTAESCPSITSQLAIAQIKKIPTPLNTSHILQVVLLSFHSRRKKKPGQYRCDWWYAKHSLARQRHWTSVDPKWCIWFFNTKLTC